MSDYSWDIQESDLTAATTSAPPRAPIPPQAMPSSSQQKKTQGPNLADLATHIPSLLRGLGAAVVVVAISALLFQNWGEADDLQRYLLLLAHTVGLGLGGFALGHWLHEGKGARTLVMLAVASIPVNVTILGALSYGQLAQFSGADFPDLAQWQLAGSASLGVVLLGSSAVLSMIALVGFRVLARRSTLSLTGLYVLLNAGLLVPTREAAPVSGLILGLLLLSCMGVQRLRSADATLATPEGWIARLVQFIPVSILLGRQLWLYQADTFMLITLSLGAFLVLRLISQRLHELPGWQRGLEMLSLFPALGAATGVAVLVDNNALFSLSLSLPFALLCGELSLRSADGPIYRRLAAAALALGGLVGLLIIGDTANSLVSLVLGLLVMVYAYASRQSLIFTLGALAFLGGLLLQLAHIGDLVDFSHWGTLAGIGVLAIVAGSLLERHGSRLYQQLLRWRQGLEDWQG